MENDALTLAEHFALYTNKNFFLTGKAGSGKTTLLKKITQTTKKNFAVVAPTGVAAINAGGVTIHSQFNLPLTSFIPSSDWTDLNLVTNRRAMKEHIRFRKDKLKVIQEMELLIVDEVSMVRADILDTIDFVMRTVRRNNKPFGGVQVMLIGDMHQLPPVVKENEWAVLKNYYNSPYFFDSLVWKQLDAAEIELTKIYRQSDERFLRLLNNIRHQQLNQEDYEELKKRYNPVFRPTEPGYILLSTHNNKANHINENELKKLTAPLHKFEAEITGDFPEHIYPCEKILLLKEGAQVMFTRNDAEKNYYNGKMATVKSIDEDKIIVTFHNSNKDYQLKQEVWENISYTIDEANDKIDKNVNGTFSQFPLRLAWAITIHKSQGLTFDKVIIDAGASFAAGQVYVALSRCRTLEGLALHSMITQHALYSDDKIMDFSNGHHSENDLEEILETAKIDFANEQLRKIFNFNKLRLKISEWKEELFESNIPDKEKALNLFEDITLTIENIIATSEKFEMQLNCLLNDFNSNKKNIVPLKDRSAKAIDYFVSQIFTLLIQPLRTHINAMAYKSKVKRYVQQLQQVEDNFWAKINQLYNAHFLDDKIYTSEITYSKQKLTAVVSSTTQTKKEKGGTYKDTLALYQKGKSIKEIAEIRSLTVGTIKGHFSRWIGSGEINIYDVLPADTVNSLLFFFQESKEKTVAAVFHKFGEKYDGNDVRMVLRYLERTHEVMNVKF